ncbi:leucine richcontaining 34 [Trypanosoma theileri]|uniref:Leucine richcontaining 34 n=1 Tax=Trypanosoma theileri TaxID=67003 RepID=A0A1X0NG92_9TRYP|nr:leucine richcontaining 34 [Trypanosoma theileri]ORC83725.1 leucine richcontaining 34 [Trypanosoma theileri]
MWEEVYTRACADSGVSPRNEILALNDGTLELRGNTFERFNHRITDDELAALSEACSRLPLVAVLHLAYNEISVRGAKVLADALQQGFNSLQFLDLSYNNLNAEAVNAITAGIESHQMLGTLLLRGNPIGGGCGDSMRNLLLNTSTLTTLDLSSTDQDMKSIVQISRGLLRNTTLTSLNLGRPLMDNPDDVAYSIHHLTLALKENRTLQSLDLNHFSITDELLRLLVTSLSDSAVVCLSLRGNKLSQDSGAILAKLLEHRTDFISLDLTANRLRDVGAVSLATAVAAHPSLRELYLCNNTIGGTGITAIAKAIAANTSLTSLELWGNDFSDESVAELYGIREKIMSMTNVDFSFYVVDEKPMLARER